LEPDAVPSRNLLVIVVAAAVSLACYSKAENNRYTSVVGHAMGLIERDFIEKVDRRKLFEGAMQGMVASLDDQYSSFIPPRHYTAFQEGLDQEFGGIGIIVEQDPKTKHLVVMSPLVNTPAYAAGLQAGDVILKIDGKPTDELASGEAVTLMRGKPGTGVHLVLRRRDSETTREVRIRREIIPVESVQGDLRNGDG
jgi:carboxyl-terminal processing protease